MPSAAILRKARKRLGESQEEFATRFGVNQSTVNRWENGGVPEHGPARIAVEHVLAGIAIQRKSKD